MANFVRTQTIEHPIGPDGRFALKVTAGDIRVRAIDGEDVTVRATFELPAGTEQDAEAVFARVRLVADAGPGRLSVEEPERRSSIGGLISQLVAGHDSVEMSVEVEMPRNGELRLETVSGDVTTEGLGGTQRYASVSGDLFVAAAGGSLRVETVSGDVTVRGSRPVAIRTEAVSGDLSLSAPRIEALRVEGVSGDVEVEGELAPNGEFRIETVSGDVAVGLIGGATFEVRGLATDISSDLDHRVEGRIDRRRVVIGDGRPSFTFNSMSGDLSIRRPRRMEPMPPAPSASALAEAGHMAVLRALERGEIDVDEASRRLGEDSDDA